MIPLPVCRWREVHFRGKYLCRSAKFCEPPNIVSAAACAECPFADHDPLPPLPPPLPCVHLGSALAAALPQSAKDSDHLPGMFACALHGRCVTDAIDQGRSTAERSCAQCTDYAARDPFGPNSTQMLRQAEDFLARVPAYPEERYHGRGVVIAGGGDAYFPSLYVTIRALRHFGCRLPIQVWYLGRKREMPRQRQALLASYGVECVDADKVRRRYPARRLDGWELKVFATLHSPYEEVLFLDADCYPCRNPEFLFDLEEYQARGAIFWPDVVAVDDRLVWSAFGVPDPRHLGSIESGQYVLDKRRCWRPLNLAWFYNNWSDYYYDYCHGDKHTFEVAWARCSQPFVMWEPKANWVDVAYVHCGPDFLPLFVHRCCDKFRFRSHTYNTRQFHPLPSFYSSLPVERECWGWLAELARLMGRRLALDEATPVLRLSQRSLKNQGRFALATLFTPETADLGLHTSRLMAAYAKRHGYQAIIAKARIDVSRPAAWSKFLLIERHFTENPACIWLLWLDVSTVIANPMQRLEELVEGDVDFLVAEDQASGQIDTSVFLVRNCPATTALFRRAYANVQYIHQPLWEQLALGEAVRECAGSLRTRFVSRDLFASFAHEYRIEDFIGDGASKPAETKLAEVKLAIGSIAKSSPHSNSLLPAPEFVKDRLPKSSRTMARGRNSSFAPPLTDLPPMFCITCRQTPERTALAAQHFRERRLGVKFFQGIHGPSFGLRTSLYARQHYQMPAGHVGVLLSHYMLWQTLTYLPHEEIMILEDDAWFEPTFRSRFRRAYADLPKDWQFVFVGSTFVFGKPVERITDHVGVMRYPCGLHAYLVKQSALPFLLHTNHEARNHVDFQLMENSLPEMKCYTFTPSLVKQRGPCPADDGTGENWPTMTAVPDDDLNPTLSL